MDIKTYVPKANPIKAYQADVPVIVHDKYGNAVAAGVGDYIIVTSFENSEITELTVVKKHVFEAEYKEPVKKDAPAK